MKRFSRRRRRRLSIFTLLFKDFLSLSLFSSFSLFRVLYRRTAGIRCLPIVFTTSRARCLPPFSRKRGQRRRSLFCSTLTHHHHLCLHSKNHHHEDVRRDRRVCGRRAVVAHQHRRRRREKTFQRSNVAKEDDRARGRGRRGVWGRRDRRKGELVVWPNPQRKSVVAVRRRARRRESGYERLLFHLISLGKRIRFDSNTRPKVVSSLLVFQSLCELFLSRRNHRAEFQL